MYILHKQTYTHGFKYEIPVTLSLEVRTIVPHYSEIPNSILSTYCSLCYTIILGVSIHSHRIYRPNSGLPF